DFMPWRAELDEDVPLGPEPRIAVEQARRDLEPVGPRRRIRHGRAAAATEGRAVRRRPLADGCVVRRDELGALDQAEIARPHADQRGERRPRGLAAPPAVTELERAHGARDLEPDAAAEAAPRDHPALLPRLRLTGPAMRWQTRSHEFAPT